MKAKAYCMSFGCLNNNKDRSLSFFTLPKDIERRRKWLTLINREDLLQKEDLKASSRSSNLVCSAHFEESSIKLIKNLKKDAIPTKFLLKPPQEGSPSSAAPSTNPQNNDNVTILSSTLIKEDSSCSETQPIRSQVKVSPCSAVPSTSSQYNDNVTIMSNIL